MTELEILLSAYRLFPSTPKTLDDWEGIHGRTLERGGVLDPCPSDHFYINISNDNITTSKSNFDQDAEFQETSC